MRLAEFIRKVMEYRLSDVRVAIPVQVESYDLATQTVKVKPLIKDIVEAEDGIMIESLPVIPSVPVSWPRAGGFFITLPIAAGDTGMVIICDRSIDRWHKKGEEAEPLDRRLHSFAGATFHPGLSDSTNPIADAHATDLVIGEDGGSSIHLKPGGQIEIGNAPSVYVALADHTHPPGTYTAPAGGGPVTGTSGASSSNSANVKID